jgi:hypothetical protein
MFRILENNIFKMDHHALEDENDFPKDSIPLLQKYVDGGKIIVACDMYSIKQIHDYHINQLKYFFTI